MGAPIFVKSNGGNSNKFDPNRISEIVTGKKNSPISNVIDASETVVENVKADGEESKSADQTVADITRGNWDNFAENDLPYIMDYARDITSNRYITRAVEQAQAGVKQASETAALAERSRMRGLGLEETWDTFQDKYKESERARAASLVDVSNSARDSAIDRQNNFIAGSGLSGMGG